MPYPEVVVARFQEPREGFRTPEVRAAVEGWTRDAEEHGHDLGAWKLRYRGSPDSGWTAKCVKCGMVFTAEPGQTSGAIFVQAGVAFRAEQPVVSAKDWATSSCTIQPVDVIRGLFIPTTDSPTAFSLLKLILARGLGPHWSHTGNRAVVESFALGRGNQTGVPVILHAQFRREDQRRNYRPAGFQALSDFFYEEEINFGNHEVLRLQAIEWHDGERWVRHSLHDVKARA